MSESVTSTVICPRCGTFSIGDLRDGQLFECPGCKVYFTARFPVAKLAAGSGDGGHR